MPQIHSENRISTSTIYLEVSNDRDGIHLRTVSYNTIVTRSKGQIYQNVSCSECSCIKFQQILLADRLQIIEWIRRRFHLNVLLYITYLFALLLWRWTHPWKLIYSTAGASRNSQSCCIRYSISCKRKNFPANLLASQKRAKGVKSRHYYCRLGCNSISSCSHKTWLVLIDILSIKDYTSDLKPRYPEMSVEQVKANY